MLCNEVKKFGIKKLFRNIYVQTIGKWDSNRVRRAGSIFPYAASKNRSEYVSIPRNLFLAYEKISTRTVRRSLKLAKFFTGKAKSAGRLTPAEHF